MLCIKCGNEVREDERYCSKCGAVNLNNIENKSMKLYAKQKDKVLAKEIIKDKIKDEKEKQNRNKKFNLLVFLIVNVFFYLLALSQGKTILRLVKYEQLISYYVIIETISYFFFVCVQLILKKANLPWWGLFIPLYNIYLLFVLATKKGINCLIILLSIIMLILSPIIRPYSVLISQILQIASLLINTLTVILLTGFIGKRFGRSFIFTVLFPFIVFPAIAFSKIYQYEY